MVNPKRVQGARRSGASLAWVLVGMAMAWPLAVQAANPDGDLRIEVLAADNFVVDSNVAAPSPDAPGAACRLLTFKPHLVLQGDP